jgi:hypothetical protein
MTRRDDAKIPAEALAAAGLLKPGQHLLAKIGDRYFEAEYPDPSSHVEVTDGRRTIGHDDVLRPF